MKKEKNIQETYMKKYSVQKQNDWNSFMGII